MKITKIKEDITSEIANSFTKSIAIDTEATGLQIPERDKLSLIQICDENNKVLVEMTLTSPNCPVAESLPNSVKENILKLDGISNVDLKLVWNPPWNQDMMSEAAKLELNL